MIYIVNCDIFNEVDKDFFDMSDDEIVALSKRYPLLVDIYESVEHLSSAWNNDDIFYPSNSYMRVIKDV